MLTEDRTIRHVRVESKSAIAIASKILTDQAEEHGNRNETLGTHICRWILAVTVIDVVLKVL